MNLSLSDAVKHEVSNTYRQYLKDSGRPVIIQTSTFQADHLKMIVNKNVTSALIPLDSTTISKLQEIETFVKENVVSEKYKPLWLNKAMYINLSKWCKYELINFDGSRQPIPVDTFLGKGMYTLEIQVSHVYLGPHKSGETFSLSLHIMGLAYQPDSNLMDLIDELDHTMDAPPSPSPPTVCPAAPTKPKRKRATKRSGRDEIDGPKNVSNFQKALH